MSNGSKAEQRAKLRSAIVLAAQRSNVGLWLGRLMEWCDEHGAELSLKYEGGVCTVRVVPFPPAPPVVASDQNPARALALVARQL